MLDGDNLMRVARALGVTTEWLLCGAGSSAGETAQSGKRNPLGLDEESLLMAQAFQALSSPHRTVVRTVMDSLRTSKA